MVLKAVCQYLPADWKACQNVATNSYKRTLREHKPGSPLDRFEREALRRFFTQHGAWNCATVVGSLVAFGASCYFAGRSYQHYMFAKNAESEITSKIMQLNEQLEYEESSKILRKESLKNACLAFGSAAVGVGLIALRRWS